MEQNTPFLKLNQAARLLGVHPQTIRRWIDAGILPLYQGPLGRPHVRREDLNRLYVQRGTEELADPKRANEEPR